MVLVALSIYAGGACGAPLWLGCALLAIDLAAAGVASVSMAQNLVTYARTGKLDGTQLFFDALDMLPLISLAGAKAAKAIGGWNCFTPGHIILAARQTRTLGNLGYRDKLDFVTRIVLHQPSGRVQQWSVAKLRAGYDPVLAGRRQGRQSLPPNQFETDSS